MAGTSRSATGRRAAEGRRTPPLGSRHTLASAAAVLFTALSIAARAQAPAAGGASPSPSPPAVKPLVPVAFSTITRNPDPYFGENVSLTATVEASLSKHAFSIDRDRATSTGKEIMVLARRMSDPIAPKTYVTVVGELVRFDPAVARAKVKDLAIDLPGDVAAAWLGRPAILATAVVNDKSVDLARFIPPPKTPEETAYNNLMRGVGSANGELRRGIAGSTAEPVTKNAASLSKALADAEPFWKARGRADAVQWLADARTSVASMEKALEGQDWAAARASSDALGKLCTVCHNAYRERLEDGSFRVRLGGR